MARAAAGCQDYSPDIDACDEAQSLAEYGRLYNWYAVDDARGLCPSGWHVPTDEEWTDLENYISSQGYSGTEGTALKSTYGWYDVATARTTLGFRPFRAATATPAMATSTLPGLGHWWSSSPSGGDCLAPGLGLRINPVHLPERAAIHEAGFRCRCLRDAD